MTEGNGQAPIGPTVGAGLSAAGGAGYRFDPDQIAALIPKWEEFRDDIYRDYVRLQTAWSDATAPSPDQPAVRNATQTQSSIKAAMDHNRAMLTYAQTWIDHLRKANGTYVEQDQEAGRGLYGDSSNTDGHGLY
ncbi:hypothetical protein L1857_33525 [Amycolatopsis thermalba]|uniref:PE domain-containing protein n=1 Tax=Amycolatopsis thermalba TaxID=944492 RepID=A0ABY4P4V6_9PSEU|nr:MULTISPECIES: hypothetical protein [Amycolatopsis]UQS27369.1 hypothetical protein L1857_33525 [Amycolatopsis thermalba]